MIRAIFCLTVLLAFGVLATPTQAQDAETSRHSVALKDGSVVRGVIEDRRKKVFVILTSVGRLTIPWARVTKIETVTLVTVPDPDTTVSAARRASQNRERAQSKALQVDVLKMLSSRSSRKRLAGAKLLVDKWPSSSAALQEALTSTSETVRCIATRALGTLPAKDVGVHLVACMSDSSARVRLMAVRVVRLHGLPSLESALLERLDNESDWPVLQETLRTLESVGTVRCLDAVLARMDACADRNRRKRFVRVLEKLTGRSFADDVDAWTELSLEGWPEQKVASED